ncbi:MAG TPA: hypothetical protein VIX73_10425 [Kofleriaceae bacterium]
MRGGKRCPGQRGLRCGDVTLRGVTPDRRRIATFAAAALVSDVKQRAAIMKNTKKRLTLRIDTVRNLTEHELRDVAGGIWTEATSCQPTQPVTVCHLKTPACPI